MSHPAQEVLVAEARRVRARAYAPYSGYRVGAALLAADGRIFTGVNVENAAYPTCVCAEVNALTTAVAAGARAFSALAVVTDPGPGRAPGAPCGNCRQALAEFGLDLEVVLATPHAVEAAVRLRDLLPDAFTPAHL